MQQTRWIFLLFWTIVMRTRAGDITVTCFVSRDCVLPCKSNYSDIEWHKAGTENPVHAFKNNEDRLDNQDAAFTERTSLFADQISKGNVSLLLRRVRVGDEGIYTCYTFSNSEDLEIIVRLDVKAPIKKVNIKFTDKGIICNTSNVYPKPIITWYENLSLQTDFTTETQTDEQGLFSLESILTYRRDVQSQSEDINTTYNCFISYEDKSQTYKASLRREKVDIYSGQDAIIHCPVSGGQAEDYTITLKFNESSTILKTRVTNITEHWAGTQVHLGHDRNVMLYKLDMDEHTGNYTCETFTELSITEVVETSLQIISDIHYNGMAEAFTAAVAVTSSISFIIYCLCARLERKKRNKKNLKEKPGKEELQLELLSGDNPSTNGIVQLSIISKDDGGNLTSSDSECNDSTAD